MVVLLATPLHAKKRIAVLDFVGDGMPMSEAVDLTVLLRKALVATDTFEVVPFEDMRTVFQDSSFEVGCAAPPCARRACWLLDADDVVVGRCTRLAEGRLVSGYTLNRDSTNSPEGFSVGVHSNAQQDIETVMAALAELLAGRRATMPVKPTETVVANARVFISTIPPVASVFMDGVFVGKTNLEELKVAAGRHLMRFEKSGRAYERYMIFEAGKNTSQMIRIP